MARKARSDVLLWDFLHATTVAGERRAILAIFDQLRSDASDPVFRPALVDIARRYGHLLAPSPHQNGVYEVEIERLRRAEPGLSRAKAMRKVAERFMREPEGFTGVRLNSPVEDAVEALKKRLKRARRERRKGDKNF
jgi:hypothetical protein